MSIKAMTWVWEHCTECSTSLLMLLAMADHCNDEGVCFPSVGRLADKCRITVRRAQQIIETLKQDGDLGVLIGKGVEANGGWTNRYFLNRYRESMGLPPVLNSSESPHSMSEIPPAKNFGEADEENFTPPPAESFREGGENYCTSPPERRFTTLPETDFRLNRHSNRHINRHLSREGEKFSTRARAREEPSHPNLETVHDVQICRSPPWINGEHDHAKYSNPAAKARSQQPKDSHLAFWQWLGATQRGHVYDAERAD